MTFRGIDLQRIITFRSISFLSVLCCVLAGCANDDAPTETAGQISPSVGPPMAGYWPLAVGNSWEFADTVEWRDWNVFAVGAANQGTYIGTLRWEIVATSTSTDGFRATIRQYFTGSGVETRLKSEQPVVWETVPLSINDSTSVFDMVVHTDGTLSATSSTSPLWDQGTSWRVLPVIHVPPAGRTVTLIEFSDFQRRAILTRNIGPTTLHYSYGGNTVRVYIDMAITTYTIRGA